MLDTRVPAVDLDALQPDRVEVSLVVCDAEGRQTDAVEANVPVRLEAVVKVNSGSGTWSDCREGLNAALTDTSELVSELMYEFEPTMGSSTAPQWKQADFLARVVAFSGPTTGLVAFVTPDNAKTEGKASAAVCLFAQGVYEFRVRVWGGGEGERVASCVVHVR